MSFLKDAFDLNNVMKKLALVRSLKLSDENSIQFLISGIGSFALQATAATLRYYSLNQFLQEMHHITSTSGESANKSPMIKTKFDKSKNNNNQHSGTSDNKDNQRSKIEKERFCTFCHKKNHTKEDCFKLKRKKSEKKFQTSQSPTSSTVSTVKETDTSTDDTVAIVSPDKSRIISTNNSVINIVSINCNCNSIK